MNYNKKHTFSLSTHQFRVRHVQGVQVKRLKYNAVTQLRLLDPHKHNVVYTSLDYRSSHNPQWVVGPVLGSVLSSRDIIIQIWDTVEKTLLIEHYVTLSALSYIGDKNSEEALTKVHPTNTILVVINDVLFHSTHGVYPDIGPNVMLDESEIKKPFCRVKSTDCIVSYSAKTVFGLHTMSRTVSDTATLYSNMKYIIGNISHSTKGDETLAIKCRTTTLNEKHIKFSACLEKDSGKLATLKAKHEERCKRRRELKGKLRGLENAMAQELDNIDWKIKYVVKTKSKLLRRRQALVTQLQDIFPIQNDGINRGMKICGVGILDQTGDRAVEEELGPALGYTTQLVCLVAGILDIPLRFPLTPALSFSTVRDDITEKLDEKRVLPLFLRGKDRFYFNYGLFLLNRNIVQLRHQCGLKTEELKETLVNLDGLVSAKLQGNMAAHPPARLVSTDKIIQRHKTKDPYLKTHKRVRSAPISYTVAKVSLLNDTRLSHSNVPSEGSSWSSKNSLGMDSMNKIPGESLDNSEADEPHNIGVDEPHNMEADEPQHGSVDGPAKSLVEEPGCAEDEDHSDDDLIDLSEDHYPADRATTPDRAASTVDRAANPADRATTAYSTTATSSPCYTPATNNAGSPSSYGTKTRSSRSSFKSYVRGSELWGMSEAGYDIARTESFKSYRKANDVSTEESGGDSRNHGDASGNHGYASGNHVDTSGNHGDASGNHGDTSGNHGDESHDSSPPTSNSLLSNNSFTDSPSEDASSISSATLVGVARKVYNTQHYTTKRYMALDSPIIIQIPFSPQPPARQQQPSPPHITITPDVCPTEVFQ